MFSVRTTYLEHDGGTKFYETVLILDSEQEGAMLIKRYGKIAQSSGAGQTLTERHSTQDEAKRENESILSEKQKYRSGKGQYVAKKDETVQVDEQGLIGMMKLHYADPKALTAADSFFDLGLAMYEPVDDDIVEEGVPVEEPVVRDGNWGTW